MMDILLLWRAFLFCSFGIGASCFSSTPPPRPSLLAVHPIKTKDHEPTIVSLPHILSADQTGGMLDAIESALQNDELVSTASYQEDIFSKDKWTEEDVVLRFIIQPLLEDGLIPSEYSLHPEDGGDPNTALQAFVFAVTNYQDLLSEENIILGANIIQRRQAIDKWKSDDGVAIMKLSLDDDLSKTEGVDWNSISLGKRYEVPPVLLDELEQLIPRLLRGSWLTRDATLVKYTEGDSQVPHIDPCDATLLICLKSCNEGGDTCFPLLEHPLRVGNREGSGILFFSSNKVTGDSGRDTLSLHHGGKVIHGEKIIVQLMLDCDDDNPFPAAESWFDIVVDA